MKLIIIESAIGPKGAHLEQGTTVEVESLEHATALIGCGKALSTESDSGKKAVARFEAEKLAGKPVKK